MTLRSDLIPVVDDARSIVDDFGLRQRAVKVRTLTRATTGLASIGTSPTSSDLTIDPRPRVSDLTRGVATAPGFVEQGDYRVTKISASYSRSQLDPGGDSVWMVDDAPCRLVKLEQRNFEWRATLVRMDRP